MNSKDVLKKVFDDLNAVMLGHRDVTVMDSIDIRYGLLRQCVDDGRAAIDALSTSKTEEVTNDMVWRFIDVSSEETAGYSCWSDAVRAGLSAAINPTNEEDNGLLKAERNAEIERLRAKLVAAEAEVGKVISDSFKRAAEITARAEAAETRLASAKEVIAPFAEFGRSHTDEHGWIDGFGNERLCNWIGPSDLRAAAEWMDKCDE